MDIEIIEQADMTQAAKEYGFNKTPFMCSIVIFDIIHGLWGRKMSAYGNPEQRLHEVLSGARRAADSCVPGQQFLRFQVNLKPHLDLVGEDELLDLVLGVKRDFDGSPMLFLSLAEE